MKGFSSWIDLDCKAHYLDSKKRGLRVVAHKGVDQMATSSIRGYLRFLRKRYFFPIRCSIHLTDNEKYRSQDKGYCCGIFFPGTEKPRRYPTIYLPVKGLNNESELAQRLFDLTALLTYYFQWYFECEDCYSHRSLEIEATKFADYLLNAYFEKIEKDGF